MVKEEYTCDICGAKYEHPSLKETCEQIPLEKQLMKLGEVFVCHDGKGIYSILYDSEIKPNSHKMIYTLVRIAWWDEKIRFVPEVKVYKEFLEKSKPINEKEFSFIKSELMNLLQDKRDSEPEHVLKIRRLELIPFQGF